MLTVEHGFVLLLFPLPFLVKFRRKKSIFLPFFSYGQQNNTRYKKHFWLIWCVLLSSISQPNWTYKEKIITPIPTWFLIDVSPSMKSEITQNQLKIEKLKEDLSIFFSQHQEKKIGVILFAKENEVFIPITANSHILNDWLAFIDTKNLGKKTNMLSALEKGVSLSKAKQQLILLSDGQENLSKERIQAIAHHARQKQIPIHFVSYDKKPIPKSLIHLVTLTGGNYHSHTHWQANLPLQKTVQKPNQIPLTIPLLLMIWLLYLLLFIRIRHDEKHAFPS